MPFDRFVLFVSETDNGWQQTERSQIIRQHSSHILLVSRLSEWSEVSLI